MTCDSGLAWKSIDIKDIEFLEENIDCADLEASDSSFVNLFVLQKKYDIKMAIAGDVVFRKYSGARNRSGYGFPFFFKKDAGIGLEEKVKKALGIVIANENASKNDEGIRFCLCSEKQRAVLDECVAKYFGDFCFDWETCRDDSDYIYEQKKLADLPGKSLHKKKNHVSAFNRAFEGRFEFRYFSQDDWNSEICKDALFVSEMWHKESLESKSDFLSSLEQEQSSIRIAIENAKCINLRGAILYLDGKACGLTLGSRISDRILDVHFEKVLASVAEKGGYAAINQFFAKSCDDFELLNREEDIGIEGLRKAKLSYKPMLVLDKYYGALKCKPKRQES